MHDDQLSRYSRHILLDDIGIEGQEKIQAAHILVIGAGGLGSPVVLYLAASGVGTLTVVDDDVVDLTNLQRQIMHTTARVGQAKVESARLAAAAINPEVQLRTHHQRATPALLAQWVLDADVVIDCSDNFITRHAVNQACVRAGKPLVSGAAIRFDGQLTVIDPRLPEAPCYACLFPAEQTFEEIRCATMGVFSPLVGIIGCMQAAEALKLVCGMPSMAGRLLLLDGRAMQWTDIQIPKRADCSVCGPQAAS
jgi:molybdopterin/thiamine biosynthesis adenylyltransferase